MNIHKNKLAKNFLYDFIGFNLKLFNKPQRFDPTNSTEMHKFQLHSIVSNYALLFVLLIPFNLSLKNTEMEKKILSNFFPLNFTTKWKSIKCIFYLPSHLCVLKSKVYPVSVRSVGRKTFLFSQE